MTDMTDSIIASDRELSAGERQLLAGVTDTLLPASADGVMPSAASVDVAAFLSGNGVDSLPRVRVLLGALDASFLALPLAEREAVLTNLGAVQPEAFAGLIRLVYACYYRDARVLAGIGMASGPPFPRGNAIEAGDLALLDPVLCSPRTWRS